ncbi:MAG: hypothetical protein RL316_379 [Bacteroidota bacterium]|jgi:hypothetical protein
MQIFIRNYSNLFAILFLILLFQSCKKSDQVASPEKELSSLERKFFFTNRTGDLTEGKLVDFLIRQNRSKSFVEKTTKIIGFPRWEKMITVKRKNGISGRGASDSLLLTYFIPFVRDSQNYVNASLIISVYPNDTTFAYRSDWEYRSKIHGSPSVDSTAEAHAVFFMFLDNRTFGYTEFYLTDDELFPLSQPIIGGKKKLSFLSISTQPTGKGQSAGYYENCVDFFVCGSPSSPTCTGPSGCDYLNCPLPPGSPGYCYLVTTVCVGGWLDPTGGSSGSTGSGSSTGSGGGGGSPDPCGSISPQKNQTASLPCGPGWNGIGLPNSYTIFIINGVTFTTLNYPGINNGLPWRWWENASILAPFGGLSYGAWAINFLSLNPQLPFSAFQNWFLKTPEYIGGEINIDPSLINYDQWPQLDTLPALSNFVLHFPKNGSIGSFSAMPYADVYQLVGGSIYNSFLNNPNGYANACAIRGSRALLYSGINIPILSYGSLGQRTQKGGDNNNYILDAVSFDKFMRDKFGETQYKLESADANNPAKVADLLNNKNGIYVIINNSPSPPPSGPGYSGHVDLILNGICISGAYTTPRAGVKSIRIWVLE